MNIIDPRARLMELTTPLPEEKKEEVASRIEEISSILSNDIKGDLKNDLPLMNRVWTFSNKNKGGKVEILRNTLLLETTCPIKSLTLAKQELNEDLWDTLAKHGVEELIITQDGEPIVYETRVLRQLLEKTPPVESFTERYTLKFEDGKELVETKANLLLCGEYIETMLGQGMRETETKVIDFSHNEMYDAFNDLLQEVKTGEREMDDDVYEILTDLLQYSKWTGIPEGAIGPEQWKEVGFEVKEVPELPGNIDEILKSDCRYFEGKKVFETHDLVLMPGGLSINNIGKRMKHLREGGHETVFEYIWDEILEEMRDVEIKEPYWALVTKEVIPGSRNKSFSEQKNLIQKGYEVPSVLDAITLATMHLESSGEKKEYLLPGESWTYTRCSEKLYNYQLVVGAFDPSGLNVLGFNSVIALVGVLALRKFC